MTKSLRKNYNLFTQVQNLGHLISEQGLHLDPGRLYGTLNVPTLKTKLQRQGFPGLASYCHNWIPNFSLMAQPLYALLKTTKPNPIFWEDSDGMTFQILKFNKPPCPWTSQGSTPFLPFCMKKKGLSLGYSPQSKGITTNPQDITANS